MPSNWKIENSNGNFAAIHNSGYFLDLRINPNTTFGEWISNVERDAAGKLSANDIADLILYIFQLDNFQESSSPQNCIGGSSINM